MALYSVSFDAYLDLDLPDDVDLEDAAFFELVDLLPTATITILGVEEI
jgi:hypothetical protein